MQAKLLPALLWSWNGISSISPSDFGERDCNELTCERLHFVLIKFEAFCRAKKIAINEIKEMCATKRSRLTRITSTSRYGAGSPTPEGRHPGRNWSHLRGGDRGAQQQQRRCN